MNTSTKQKYKNLMMTLCLLLLWQISFTGRSANAQSVPLPKGVPYLQQWSGTQYFFNDGNVVRTSAAMALSDVVEARAAVNRTLYRKADGTVWEGSGTTTGAIQQIYGLSGITQIDVGEFMLVALKGDGTVYYRRGGIGSTELIVVVAGLTNVTEVKAGSNHLLALKADGTVSSLGENGSGQLGNGIVGQAGAFEFVPQTVSGLATVVDLAAAGKVSAAVKADGSVVTWGADATMNNNPSGRDPFAGNGLLRVTPVAVSGIAGVADLAVSAGHALALKTDDTVWAWGKNTAGQLANGAFTPVEYTPRQVNGLTGQMMIDVACNNLVSFALRADGTVWVWGGATWAGATGAQTLAGLPGSGVTEIACGDSHLLALNAETPPPAITTAATFYNWGSNRSGELGNGYFDVVGQKLPGRPVGMANIVEVAAIQSNNIALTADGSVYQSGGGYSAYFTKVNGLSNVVSIAAGHGWGSWTTGYGLAMTQEGKVYLWEFSPIPIVKLLNITNVQKMVGGGQGAWFLLNDGTVKAIGDNYNGRSADPLRYLGGRLGVGSMAPTVYSPLTVIGLSDVKAIAAGNGNYYALKSDGTVWSGGRRPQQILAFSNITAIVAGGAHQFVFKSDGTIWAWGDNSYGQLGLGWAAYPYGVTTTPVPVNLTDIVSLTCAGSTTYALKRDGTVWGWGLGVSNGSPYSVVPVQVGTLTNVIKIGAGGSQYWAWTH